VDSPESRQSAPSPPRLRGPDQHSIGSGRPAQSLTLWSLDIREGPPSLKGGPGSAACQATASRPMGAAAPTVFLVGVRTDSPGSPRRRGGFVQTLCLPPPSSPPPPLALTSCVIVGFMRVGKTGPSAHVLVRTASCVRPIHENQLTRALPKSAGGSLPSSRKKQPAVHPSKHGGRPRRLTFLHSAGAPIVPPP